LGSHRKLSEGIQKKEVLLGGGDLLRELQRGYQGVLLLIVKILKIHNVVLIGWGEKWRLGGRKRIWYKKKD